jgi:hypothetical protein
MKFALTLAAIALVSAATAQSAQAYSFTPKSTSFTATGSLQLTALGATVTCRTALTGATTANGLASITGARFSGTSSVCALVKAAALPWPMTARSLVRATIGGVTISGGAAGTCGPSRIAIAVTEAGKLKFHDVTLSGPCSATGSLQTSPVITITTP